MPHLATPDGGLTSGLIAVSTFTSKSTAACQICLDDVDELISSVCSASCPASVCLPCATEYIRVHAAATPKGVLSKLKCPICVRPVNLMRWKSLHPTGLTDVVTVFSSRVQAACEVLCPSCDRVANLLPRVRKCNDDTGLPPLLLPSSHMRFIPLVRRYVMEFCIHERSISSLWSSIDELFPQHVHAIVRHALRRIHDVERRTTLYLRLLRDDPFVWTPCCKAELCFTCQTRYHHANIPCAVKRCDLNEVMVQCALCHLVLTKGDGCNWVTCYCGHGFDWATATTDYTLKNLPPRLFRALQGLASWMVVSRRLRRQVLPHVVCRVKMQHHRRPWLTVCEFLRRRAWKSKFTHVVHSSSSLPYAVLRRKLRHIDSVLSSTDREMRWICRAMKRLVQRGVVQTRKSSLLIELQCTFEWENYWEDRRRVEAAPPQCIDDSDVTWLAEMGL